MDSSSHPLLSATKTLTSVGVSVLAVALVGLYSFQSSLIYPSSLNDGHGVVNTPDQYGMDYEDVELTTTDGVHLKCFALRHEKTPKYTNKTVVILCPNAGNIGHSLPIVELFYKQLNYNVFIYSYRGYGHSTGAPSELGLKKDADTVMEYLRNDEIYSTSSLVLYGRSLGGAVAIYIASTYPEMISGVILENTFLSIRKVIPYIFPFLKYFTYMCHQVWNSEDLITKLDASVPVCFLNGLKDEVVPPPHMKTLFENCSSENKEFHAFSNGHHNDTVSQEEYWSIVHGFIMDKVNPMGY